MTINFTDQKSFIREVFFLFGKVSHGLIALSEVDHCTSGFNGLGIIRACGLTSFHSN
jgi:hypothetical protein